MATRIVRMSLALAALWLCGLAFGELASAQTPPAAVPAVHPASTMPQPKPATGFVSPYEIVRTVRSAGFRPLSRPLREGASYVLRATDFRGLPMRIVLDARTGVIRDATRIVPAGAMSAAPPPVTEAAPAASPPPAGKLIKN